MLRRSLTTFAAAACVSIAAGAAAAGPPQRELPEGVVFAGQWKPLQARATYGASRFPIGLRVTVPDAGWIGTQWKANQFSPVEIQRRHLTCASNPKVCAPPYYGWVSIGKPPSRPGAAPRALIMILSGFSPTPSPATVARQLCRPRSVSCDPPSPVTLAGFRGLQLDGRTTGAATHLLIPFTPPSTFAGKAYGDGAPDLIFVDGAHPFRATVLDVRGKTVLVLVGTLVLSPDEFDAFLPEADRVLDGLRFPKGG